MNPPPLLSVVILTRDEELNLPACLASLNPLGVPVFVVDSGSTDGTVAIARAAGAQVAAHPFETHTLQWRWALENLPTATPWVLGLDADQRLTPELAVELRGMLADGGRALDGVDGVYLNRRQIFRGRWIRHGGYYPKYLLKLFRRAAVRLDERDLMDHHFHVDGPTRRAGADLVEENHKEDGILFWSAKHIRYADLHAREYLAREAGEWGARARLGGTPDERAAWLRRAGYRLPPYLRAVLYFLYRYVLRLGFLDGREGFVFHAMQGFWYRLLVDVRMEEIRHSCRVPTRATAHAPDRGATPFTGAPFTGAPLPGTPLPGAPLPGAPLPAVPEDTGRSKDELP